MAGKKDSKQERKRIDSVTKKILQQDAARQRYESGRPEDLPLQSEDWKFALGMAGLSGLLKAIPAVGAELAAYGPLYKQAAKTLLTDIPAFETIGRMPILLKLDRPWSKVSAKEGWAPDYIPKARIRTDIDKEVRDILKEFASGASQVSLETPESASYITIKYNLGGPLLLKPYAGGGGLSRSKDYKSSKKPYPSVKSGDFAGGGRSYPIPTKADAVDALRLAGLHHRPDVKAKVYAKYPSLKHADGGPLDNGIDYSGIETTNNRKYNQDYISYIDSALANAQLPDAKRASILANIIEESGGDPFALDSTGKFYGLLQWADDRYSPTGELDPYREIDNQVANIVNTLGNTTDGKSWTHGGTGSGYNSYKDAMADFDNEDLATAMKGFTLGYVRPSGKIDSYNNRLKVAQQILDKYNNVPEKKAATLIEKMKAAFGNDTEAMQRLINAAKSSGGFR